MKEMMICACCEKKFKINAHQAALIERGNAKNVFCSRECYRYFYGTHLNIEIPESKRACYLAEARAMLTGKHWQGKNKCTKLEGDV